MPLKPKRTPRVGYSEVFTDRKTAHLARAQFKTIALISLLTLGSRILRAEDGSPPTKPADVVAMDSFIVEAIRPDSHPWRYLAIPGFEILSKSRSDITRARANWLLNQVAIEHELMPFGAFPSLPVPHTLILFDYRQIDETERSGVQPSPRWLTEDKYWWPDSERTGLLAGAIIGRGGDTTARADNTWNFDRWYSADAYENFADQEVNFAFRLNLITPQLPNWFMVGLSGDLTSGVGIYDVRPQTERMLIPGPVWLSLKQTQEILDSAARTHSRPLLYPLAEFFRPTHRQGPQPAAWNAEAALFVRWAYFGSSFDGPDVRSAFWQFLTRARKEPVTEAMFKECFGSSYADADAKLARFLLAAAHRPIEVRYRFFKMWPPNKPAFEERTPTKTEIARILGDWERLTGDTLARSNPKLSKTYLDAAGKTLGLAESSGTGDPLFLAADGLYYADIHDDAKAEALLSKATAAGVQRPAAYLRLAYLRLRRAINPAVGSQDAISANEVNSIVEPFYAASRLMPLPERDYRELCTVFMHAPRKPDPRDFRAMREGLEIYPLSSGLTYDVARVFAKWGESENARDLVARGRLLGEDGFANRLSMLEESLQRSDKKAP